MDSSTLFPLVQCVPDMATLLVGIASLFVRPVRCMLVDKKFVFNRSKSLVDFLNDVSLVPFAVMVGSTFYTKLFEEVLRSKGSLGIAGSVGLLFVLGEVLGAGSKPTE